MRIVSAVLAIALVVASGLAIHFSREAAAGRQRIAQLDSQLARQQAELAALAGNRTALPASLELPSSQAAIPPAATAPPTQVAPPVSARIRDLTDMIQAQMSTPEGLARRRESSRLLMSTSNPDVGEALGLAPEEVDKLLDLLATQQERTSGVFLEARQSGDQAAAQQQVAAALEEHRRSADAELQELLGAKYAQWQDYQQTRPVWQQRRDLRAVLDAAGTPLTETQGRSLIAALAAEQRNISQTRGAITQPFAANSAEQHQRLLGAAAPHLSAQQLESYRQMLERVAARDEAMYATFREASAAAEAAAQR